MNNKKMNLLILGAGVYQVPLITKAKQLGHEVILVSWKGNYPGFQLVDKVYYEDTKDYSRILEIAQKEKIDGIITTGTDVPVISIGHVNDHMNLTGVSKKSALYATNKLEMKKKFIELDVRTASFICAKTVEDAEKAFESFSKPIIIKAVDSSGSRGITKVVEKNEIETAVKEVFDVTRSDYFLVEEFIEGKKYGAEALVVNGKVEFVLPNDEEVYFSKTGVPIGHSAPISFGRNLLQDIETQVKKAIKATEINNSAVNVDFIVKNDKTYIIEIAARAGATCLPELVSITYGIDYYKMIIDVALGRSVEIKLNDSKPNASLLLYSEKEGVIKQIINNNKEESCIVDISFDYAVGDFIKKFEVGPDRIGQIITTGNTLDDAKKNLFKVRNNITIELEDAKCK